MRGLAGMLAVCLWSSAVTATAQSLPKSSGWYTWRVAALDGNNNSCCYSWQFGESTGGACRLGEDGLEAAQTDRSTSMRPGQRSTDVRIFARLEEGRIVDARALSTQCPVDAAVQLEDLGSIDAQVSLAWFRSAWGQHEGEESLLPVIAQHAGGDEVLIDLAEDPNLDKSQRKKALFWLAESATDRAVAWFENLLNN